MPELPEVETTVSMLKSKTLGKVFFSIWAEDGNEKRLKEAKNKKIKEIKRFGKSIIFFLEGNVFLFVHLRMTGHFLFGKWEKKFFSGGVTWVSREKVMKERKNGFLRYIFFLDDGNQIALSDQRKFAKVKVISKEEMEKHIARLGPDPLLITKEEFFKLFKNKKKAIKPLLMDQSFLSGIGNIYAAEVLFKAKVDPKKKANYLTEKEKEDIYFFIKNILKKALKLKGDSTSDYRLLTGEKGGYQDHHLVYNRAGLHCFVCKEKIKRVNIGGRGSYFCPKCQK